MAAGGRTLNAKKEHVWAYTQIAPSETQICPILGTCLCSRFLAEDNSCMVSVHHDALNDEVRKSEGNMMSAVH
eukprot:338142-Pelagomonas_calceolata.AAC.1